MIGLFLKGGALMWPILVCSIVALAVALSKALQYRAVLGTLARSPAIVRDERPPFFAALLDGIARGLGDKELSLIGTRQIKELEKGLGVLALISVIAPLLGLTGTVTGMIRAFQIIASLGSQVNPGLLAGGIWEALLTTAAGLFVAIPVHIAHHFLEERLDEIALSMKEVAMALAGEN